MVYVCYGMACISYLSSYGIQFIYENNRRSFLFGQCKRISDHLGSITNEHLAKMDMSQITATYYTQQQQYCAELLYDT